MKVRFAALALSLAVTVSACAGPAKQVADTPPPPSASPTPPTPEPPRQADQLARIASELAEVQNAVAKLMMSARQHDDQLLYLQRRLVELEGQARSRSGAPPAFAPSAGVPAPLPAPLPPPPAAAAPAAPAPPSARMAPTPVTPPATASVAPRTATPPSAPRPEGPASDLSGSPADAMYQAGFEKYQAGDLDGAVVALYEVVANFPRDPARERAQFLVGEIFLAQKDYRGAVAELEGLVAAVPGGRRTPEALLKIGTAYRALGDEARARRTWDRLVKEHPNSAAARQARTLLKAGRG